MRSKAQEGVSLAVDCGEAARRRLHEVRQGAMAPPGGDGRDRHSAVAGQIASTTSRGMASRAEGCVVESSVGRGGGS
jgi:hypothetical protein